MGFRFHSFICKSNMLRLQGDLTHILMNQKILSQQKLYSARGLMRENHDKRKMSVSLESWLIYEKNSELTLHLVH
jgi:hypothetical protein